jgi:dsRNA-specific ribonuclease
LIIAELHFYKYPSEDEGLLTHLSQQYSFDEADQVILAAFWAEKRSYTKMRKWVCTKKGLKNELTAYPCEPREINSNMQDIELKIAYRFSKPALLAQALTRNSAINERIVCQQRDYQSLEFLGDRILGMVIADILHETSPDISKEERADRFMSYTHNHGPLAKVARKIRLGRGIIMGAGEDRANQKILSDHMEALLGAIWIDSNGDYELIYALIKGLWSKHLKWGLSDSKPDLLKNDKPFIPETAAPTPAAIADCLPTLPLSAAATIPAHSTAASAKNYALALKVGLRKGETSVARKADIVPSLKEDFPALGSVPVSKAPVLNYASLLKRDKAPSPEKAAPGH